jgi:ATP-dependent Clp protease adaptor protein ClpS
MADTQPGVVEQLETETRTALPWNVIVHNDPISLMSYVTMVFQKLFGYSFPKAYALMMEVHTEGRSVVWSGSRERAEVYVTKLHAYHLQATMERPEA